MDSTLQLRATVLLLVSIGQYNRYNQQIFPTLFASKIKRLEFGLNRPDRGFVRQNVASRFDSHYPLASNVTLNYQQWTKY